MRCTRPVADSLQPFERKGQVRAALGGHERVDLIDDHRIDAAQARRRVRGQQQVQRLRRSDEDLRRVAAEAAAFFLRCVAGADADLRRVKDNSCRPRHVRDAGERRAQVALHVDGQRLQRTDVDDPAAFAGDSAR